MQQAALIYFLESLDGATAPAPGHAGDRLARKEPAKGPQDAMGALVTPCAGLMDLEYAPEHQAWTKIAGEPGQPRVWVGVDRRGAIGPEIFARDEIRSGHKVVLGDGRAWEIPVARLTMGGSGLPRRRVVLEGGRLGWQVEEAYRALTEFAERVWSFHNGGDVLISEEETDAACGAALSINYRLGVVEAAALGLLTDGAVKGIVMALIDFPTIQRWLDAQKKSGATAGT